MVGRTRPLYCCLDLPARLLDPLQEFLHFLHINLGGGIVPIRIIFRTCVGLASFNKAHKRPTRIVNVLFANRRAAWEIRSSYASRLPFVMAYSGQGRTPKI